MPVGLLDDVFTQVASPGARIRRGARSQDNRPVQVDAKAKFNTGRAVCTALAAVIGHSTAVGVLSADWRPAGYGEGAIVYIHEPTARFAPGKATVWVLFNFGPSAKRKYRSMKVRYSIDCVATTYAMSLTTTFSRIDGEGEVLTTGSTLESAYQEAAPDTLNAALIREACSRPVPAPSVSNDPDTRRLDAAMPDWPQVITSPQFHRWLNAQPARYQRLCRQSSSEEEVIDCLNDFRAYVGKPSVTLR